MMTTRTVAVFLVALLSLVSNNAFAWFKICNNKSNGATMYVTYAYYVPNTSKVYTDACGSYEGVQSGYYTTWRNRGWWYLTQNQCATVYGSTLNNSWSYVYAQISDGSHLSGANVSFTVSNVAFTLDQYTNGPYQCGSPCVGVSAIADCSPTPNYWNVNTLGVNTGNYDNFTFSIN